MGYNIDYSGHIEVSPPLNEAEVSYLNDFSDAIHTKSTHRILELNQPGSLRLVDTDHPPRLMPGIQCNWSASSDGATLSPRDGEKIHDHDRWLAFIITHLFNPTNPRSLINAHRDDDPRLAEFVDHNFFGEIHARGEHVHDIWAIRVGDASKYYNTPGNDVGVVDLYNALLRIPHESLADLTFQLDPYV